MNIYLVGGAVRDRIMGNKPKDLDYVVVGSTKELMIEHGFKQVGSDFPVFLHPKTGDEYALARTEVSTGEGYNDFVVDFNPTVTLEEDLSRRDLTINAMALDILNDELIDPFNGQDDLLSGLLRPTSKAFKDDPVRVLRAARFLARFPAFSASTELIEYMNEMVKDGELKGLKPERVWKETEKALSEKMPSRYFKFLSNTGVFPEIEAMKEVKEDNKYHPEYDVFTHIMMGIDYAVRYNDPIITFGVLCHDFGKPEAYMLTDGLKSTKHEKIGLPIVEGFCDRLKAPNDFKKMAMLACEYHTHIHMAFEMKPKTIHKYLSILKTKTWVLRLVYVATADKRGRGLPVRDRPYEEPNYMLACWKAMKTVNSKNISRGMEPGPQVGIEIRRAEIRVIASVVKSDYKG